MVERDTVLLGGNYDIKRESLLKRWILIYRERLYYVVKIAQMNNAVANMYDVVELKL